MCSEVEAGNFTTMVYIILINVGESVMKMTETVWKNSIIVAKNVRIIQANFNLIAITFSEKKSEASHSYRPSYLHNQPNK
jgi:hypothetical protein